MRAQWSFPHHADDRVATDGGNPVRPISTCGGSSKAMGEEIKEKNAIPNTGEVGSEGEEIRRNPTPGSSPNAKHAVKA
ncbi:hypothetical protein Acr_00g0022550 [Actinidia rufa]|uniref:Uncharacterized protein n=1 Tax=Actinidia rufa TaxID=165716 RepID=A0A7J0DED1_9ERIC|nr:hypothetical protein Acr_00g0022550 [Actinidia rufa]